MLIHKKKNPRGLLQTIPSGFLQNIQNFYLLSSGFILFLIYVYVWITLHVWPL